MRTSRRFIEGLSLVVARFRLEDCARLGPRQKVGRGMGLASERVKNFYADGQKLEMREPVLDKLATIYWESGNHRVTHARGDKQTSW